MRALVFALVVICSAAGLHILKPELLKSDLISLDDNINHQLPMPDNNSNLLSSLKLRLSDNLIRLKQQLFHVDKISIHGNKLLDRSALLSWAGLTNDSAEGGWIWNIDPYTIQSRLQNNPYLESSKVELGFWPLSLNVTLNEINPWLVAYSGGRTWLVSKNGDIVQALETMKGEELIVQTSGLPRLEGLDGDESAEIAGKASARFNYALKILNLFNLAGGMPFEVARYVVLKDGGIRVEPAHPDYPEVFLDAEELVQAKQKLQQLSYVISDMGKSGEKPKLIDLRFKDQAVVQ
jgi:hypothetical protein